MTPEEKNKLDRLEKLANSMIRGENLELNKNLERHLNFLSGSFVLSDAIDVSSSTPSSGQVLKWNGTVWAPGTDNV